MAEDWQNGGFGLYVHWPFCQAKCPYCDFNSHVAERIDQDRWATAYLSEIDRIAAETGPRVLNSIFFGGGTPSLMEPELVAAIIARARAVWPTGNDIEITLEANPTSVEAHRFRGYRAAGVNRLSLGVQALDDPSLKALGRLHSAQEALTALDIARDTFDRISFDLIYARQHQSLGDWRDELTRALSFGPEHLSLYQLTIEDGTVFGRRHAAGRLPGLPGDDLSADMYALTTELCAAAGLPAYEVSNHAKPGAESRHNLIYWRYGDYAGIGPGAHGRLTLDGQRYATQTPLAPTTWLDQVARTGSGEEPRAILRSEEQASELLLMGLRLTEGLSLDRYTNLAGNPLNTNNINELEGFGMVRRTGDRLIATPEGRMVLNRVIAELEAP